MMDLHILACLGFPLIVGYKVGTVHLRILMIAVMKMVVNPSCWFVTWYRQIKLSSRFCVVFTNQFQSSKLSAFHKHTADCRVADTLPCRAYIQEYVMQHKRSPLMSADSTPPRSWKYVFKHGCSFDVVQKMALNLKSYILIYTEECNTILIR